MRFHSLNDEDDTTKKRPLGRCWVYLSVLIITGLGTGVVWLATHQGFAAPATPAAPATLPPTPSLPINNDSSIPQEIQDRMESFRDPTADPCEDFYQHACGTFLETADASNGKDGILWEAYRDINDVISDELHEVMKADFPFVGVFQDSCVDTSRMNKRGFADLQPFVALIDSVTDYSTFMGAVAQLTMNGLGDYIPVSFVVSPDFASGDRNALSIDSKVWSKYYSLTWNKTALSEVFQKFLNISSNKEAVSRVENALSTRAALTGVSQAKKTPPGPSSIFTWSQSYTAKGFMSETGFDLTPLLSTIQDEAVTPISPPLQERQFLFPPVNLPLFHSYSEILYNLTSSDINVAKDFLILQFLLGETDTGSPLLLYLNQYYRDAYHQIRPYAGIPSKAQREKDCELATKRAFQDLIAHVWVNKFVDEDTKTTGIELVDEIYKNLKTILQSLDWLDDETKTAALQKYDNIATNVAYTSFWLDYVGVDNSPFFFASYTSVQKFLFLNSIQTLEGRVNRHQMPSQVPVFTANAFYYPPLNSINMLAGMMQQPFFSSTYPLFFNLGYGAIIGHEFFHAFDNTGRMFNGTGAYVNWWTNASDANFNQRANCLVDQYSDYMFMNISLNGNTTLGENLADMGGLHVAYLAYKSSPPTHQWSPSYTNEQLFFLNYAQNWCTAYTEEAAEISVKYDPHTVNPFRVVGTLQNFKPFAKAFKCSPTSGMGRSMTPKKCDVY